MVAVILINSRGVIDHLYHHWSNGIIVSDMYSFFVTLWYPWHDIAAGYSVQCLNIHDDTDFYSAKTYECICSFHLFPTLRANMQVSWNPSSWKTRTRLSSQHHCCWCLGDKERHGLFSPKYFGFGTRHISILWRHLGADQLQLIMGNFDVWFVARLFRQSSTNILLFHVLCHGDNEILILNECHIIFVLIKQPGSGTIHLL